MAEIPQARPDLSQVELLLDQHKYEEALAPLTRLIEENPANLQMRIYRLLTVRILLLRETLAQSIYQTVEPPRAVARKMSSKATDALRTFIAPHLTRAVHLAWCAIAASRSGEVVRRAALAIGIAGVFVTPITFWVGVAEQQLRGAAESIPVANSLSTPAATALNFNQRTAEWLKENKPSGLAPDRLPRFQRINGDLGPTSGDRMAGKSAADVRVEPALANATPVSVIAVASKQRRNFKSVEDLQVVYKTRGSLSLRQEPRFGSASLQQIDGGTPISVLGENGNWLKVKTSHSSAVGYLRKEFLVAANTAP